MQPSLTLWLDPCSRLKAMIFCIFFVREVTRCGVLASSVQSLMVYHFKTKSRKRWLNFRFRRFPVIRNFDDVLRIRYLNVSRFELKIDQVVVEFSYGVKTDLVASFSNCCDGVE